MTSLSPSRKILSNERGSVLYVVMMIGAFVAMLMFTLLDEGGKGAKDTRDILDRRQTYDIAKGAQSAGALTQGLIGSESVQKSETF